VDLDYVKLKPSKAPVIDALVYCALKGIGVHIVTNNSEKVVLKVTDFDKYYTVSSKICSKVNPTEDRGSRIKSLQRWFTDFPSLKEMKGGSVFNVQTTKESKNFEKIREMIANRQNDTDYPISLKRKRLNNM